MDRFSLKILSLILFIAFLLRFLALTTYPQGFNADEASFGYDAYSLSKTGRDQWGNTLPLVLKSFGDYKAPLYSYLASPFVTTMGLNKFAVRLPGAIIGTLAVLVVYLLIKKILDHFLGLKSHKFAFFGAWIMAINPWAVMMSRGAFESNLLTFLIPLGIYLFLLGIDRSRWLMFSSLVFGISLFAYHSGKLITPLIVLSLVSIFWKKLSLKKSLTALFVFGVFLIALLYTFKIGGGARISERSIVQGALEEGAEAKIKLILEGKNPTVSKLLHNKYQVILRRFTTNYTQYFSYKFLIARGAAESSYGMIPGIGVLHFFEFVLFVSSFTLIWSKKLRPLFLIIFGWLLVSILPAALSSGVGYAGNRAMGAIPVFQIMSTLGLIAFSLVFKNKKIQNLFLVFLIAVSIFETGSFIKRYFKEQPTGIIQSMLYGSLEASKWLVENSGDKGVIVSRSLSEPQIFIAFAGPFTPSDFQKYPKTWGLEKHKVNWVDQIPEYKVANYTFKSIDWDKDSKLPNTLMVAKVSEVPQNFKFVKTFNYPNGEPNIVIVDTTTP